jgi:hypothetical protein
MAKLKSNGGRASCFELFCIGNEGVSKSFRTESIYIYIYINNNKHSSRSNTKGYGDETH